MYKDREVQLRNQDGLVYVSHLPLPDLQWDAVEDYDIDLDQARNRVYADYKRKMRDLKRQYREEMHEKFGDFIE